LITTRAGLPQQDLSSGVLHVGVAAGTIKNLRAPNAKAERAWRMAFPQKEGDVLNLRAMEQGLEQMRRIPRRDVKIDIDRSRSDAGTSDLILTLEPSRPISGTLGINNFSGQTVGRWQGAASLSGIDLLGLNDLWTFNYNSRLASPAPPASSQGSGASVSLPYGWWTFSLAGSAFEYGQQVNGEIATFESTGRSRNLELSAERVIHRDQASRSSLRAKISRRSSRAYIEGVEIGLQRQDLADYEIALIDRRRLLRAQFDTVAAWRQGVPWFDAQVDQPGRPSNYPTTRYRIATLDVSVQAPIDRLLLASYRGELRGQWTDTPLFGSDLFAVGGPFSVRGFDSDQARLGPKGWFLRQTVDAKSWRGLVQPYALLDAGQISSGSPFMAGAGLGLRAGWRGLSLDAFAAAPIAGHRQTKTPRFGVSAGYGF
jgi:hemolysin activation/secretion protein